MTFVEITTDTMDPSWVRYYPGIPGTILHANGGAGVCVRCYATGVTPMDHVCGDIQRGARRWTTLANIPGTIEYPAVSEPEFIDWPGSEDAASSVAEELDYEYACLECGWEPGGDDGHHGGGHEYGPKTPPAGTGEYAILCKETNYDPIFPKHYPDDHDEPIWYLGEYWTAAWQEEGEYVALTGNLTVEQCRAEARRRGIRWLYGDDE